MVKLIFSLEHKDSEWVNSRTYLGWMRLGPFIESLEWVYLLEAIDIVEMYELSGENGVNFGEFTPHFEVRVSGLTI